jgi:uncharacterized protein (UPF0332 family)
VSFPDEVQSNLDRAYSSLQAARLLLESGLPDDSASRAYYAVFHAASALLLSKGLSFNSHSGVLRAISLNFVKTGQLDRTVGRNLSWLAEIRQVGDYGELRRVSSADASRALEIANNFVAIVDSLLES